MKNKVTEFEKEYGTLAFIKVCISVLNKLLVEKGLISEADLKKLLEQELDEQFKIK